MLAGKGVTIYGRLDVATVYVEERVSSLIKHCLVCTFIDVIYRPRPILCLTEDGGVFVVGLIRFERQCFRIKEFRE